MYSQFENNPSCFVFLLYIAPGSYPLFKTKTNQFRVQVILYLLSLLEVGNAFKLLHHTKHVILSCKYLSFIVCKNESSKRQTNVYIQTGHFNYFCVKRSLLTYIVWKY